jgi:paired amphipathic helix protein Sin3a
MYSQRKRSRTAPFKPIPNAALDKTGTLEELEFFEKCKRVIGNKSTYNEFLKVLNLFSQELIDSKVLVERVEPFLSKAPELFEWFKKFVRYEEDDLICKLYSFLTLDNVPVEKPDIDLKTCKKSGHSYRMLPANVRLYFV